MIYGYVRVSSRDQNEDRQLIAMYERGVPVKKIYTDKQSGKDFNRPQYQALLRRLKADDIVYVKSIDRLGRNYDEILRQWRIITKEKGACIVVIDMPLLDTRRKGDDLTGTFIADLVLQILSYVAETERNNIKKRQAEGIAAARLRGVKFGAPPLEIPSQFYPLLEEWCCGRLSGRECSRRLSISPHTFKRWCNISNQNI